MKVRIEINENQLRSILIDYLQKNFPQVNLCVDFLTIEVKSKQNYKSEWEHAAYRAIYEKNHEATEP